MSMQLGRPMVASWSRRAGRMAVLPSTASMRLIVPRYRDKPDGSRRKVRKVVEGGLGRPGPRIFSAGIGVIGMGAYGPVFMERLLGLFWRVLGAWL